MQRDHHVEFCDAHQLTVRERLELSVTVCQATQHAHLKGIIHRDIKPSNVLVTLHDDRPVVKVIDFGVAKATSGPLTDKTLFTGFLQMLGTPLYMSPEQTALSGVDIDTRSDIYSLGVLLYELLTGATPFDKSRLHQAAIEEICRIIREEEPKKPSSRLTTLKDTLPTLAVLRKTEPHKLGQFLRGDLDWIVMKALEKDRTRRYQTANEFAHDVQNHLADQPVTARPPLLAYVLRKFARRNRRSVAVALSISVALFFATLMSAKFARLRDESRRTATQEKLERIRHAERFAGWSENCTELLSEAAALSPVPLHQDYAVAILQDTDMQLLRQWTDFDAGSVRFAPDSKGLGAGGLPGPQMTPANVWLDINGSPILSSVPAIGSFPGRPKRKVCGSSA